MFLSLKPSDRVDVCQFDLQNKSLWKAMSEEAVNSVCENLGLVEYNSQHSNSLQEKIK